MKRPKLSEEASTMLPIIDGPVWPDHCEHGIDSFIASFRIPMNKTLKAFDLYVFTDNHAGQEVCIRYGNEDSQYISPGRVIDFIQTACCHQQKAPEYWSAYEILKACGTIKWTPTP